MKRLAVVIETAELLKEVVEIFDGGCRVAGVQPVFQCLPEPFSLAAGLRMQGRGVDGA